MKEFTGWEYLLIDVANNHYSGLDKSLFEERIEWATQNLEGLEEEAKDRIWKERPMYIKAVAAVRKAQHQIPTGHLMGFDAVCSGMQIMSALTGCFEGAKATGLVDQHRRADAYTDLTMIMTQYLGQQVMIKRDSVKNAVMTSLYGSTAEPKKEFGEGSSELDAFYKCMFVLCPGACELLQILLNSWQPYALEHSWKLPDGFDAKVKVMEEQTARIEIDELNHSTFTYVWYENEGSETGKKNAANVVHSIDGYVLRTLIRRCNYDAELLEWAHYRIGDELVARALDPKNGWDCNHSALLQQDEKFAYYVEQFERSSLADIVILPHLGDETLSALNTDHLQALAKIINTMREHEPFELISVHDDFKCHPNNMNSVRKHYRNILADLADSDVLQDILCQIHGTIGTFPKKSHDLSKYIRQSNYALS